MLLIALLLLLFQRCAETAAAVTIIIITVTGTATNAAFGTSCTFDERAGFAIATAVMRITIAIVIIVGGGGFQWQTVSSDGMVVVV